MGPAARHICRRAGLLNIRFLIADLNIANFMYSTFETGLYSSTCQVSKIHGFYLETMEIIVVFLKLF